MNRQLRTRRAQTTVRWIVIAAIVLACVVAVGFMLMQWIRPVVTVTEVVEGPVVQAFYSTGTIQPEREYPIKSATEGTLTEVRVDKGDRVKKGDVLAIVTDPALIFTAEKARAELDEKLKRADEKDSPILKEYDAKLAATGDLLEIAKREQARVSSLMERNAGSQTDLDRAIDRVKILWSDIESLRAQRAAKIMEMQREVDVAKSALSIAQWNLDQQTLKAPIDGAVLDRPIAVGTRVAVNDSILRIADVTPNKLVMRAAVDEEDVTKVRIGQTVRMTLYAFPGQVLSGIVEKIYDQADADRRTFEIDIQFTEPNDRFQPGMTGELAFVMAEKASATVVPAQALQGGAIYVVRDSRLVRLSPQIGIKSVERVEVISGLNSNDAVVISALSGDRDGQSVRTARIDPRVAAGLNKPVVVEQAFKSFSN